MAAITFVVKTASVLAVNMTYTTWQHVATSLYFLLHPT